MMLRTTFLLNVSDTAGWECVRLELLLVCICGECYLFRVRTFLCVLHKVSVDEEKCQRSAVKVAAHQVRK